MTKIHCSLSTCGHRAENGICRRPKIKLQQTESKLNEMFCLGWETPEVKMFQEAVTGVLFAFGGKYFFLPCILPSTAGVR